VPLQCGPAAAPEQAEAIVEPEPPAQVVEALAPEPEIEEAPEDVQPEPAHRETVVVAPPATPHVQSPIAAAAPTPEVRKISKPPVVPGRIVPPTLRLRIEEQRPTTPTPPLPTSAAPRIVQRPKIERPAMPGTTRPAAGGAAGAGAGGLAHELGHYCGYACGTYESTPGVVDKTHSPKPDEVMYFNARRGSKPDPCYCQALEKKAK